VHKVFEVHFSLDRAHQKSLADGSPLKQCQQSENSNRHLNTSRLDGPSQVSQLKSEGCSNLQSRGKVCNFNQLSVTIIIIYVAVACLLSEPQGDLQMAAH
jgi:hypothetical protein